MCAEGHRRRIVQGQVDCVHRPSIQPALIMFPQPLDILEKIEKKENKVILEKTRNGNWKIKQWRLFNIVGSRVPVPGTAMHRLSKLWI